MYSMSCVLFHKYNTTLTHSQILNYRYSEQEERGQRGNLTAALTHGETELVFFSFFLVSHLEERNPFALVEDEVLIDEGRLCGHAFITGAQLFLQRALRRTQTSTHINITHHFMTFLH